MLDRGARSSAARRWGVRARLAEVLSGSAPGGCTVLTGYVWAPPGWTGRELRPDVAVHRSGEPDLRPTGAPVLCVDVIDSVDRQDATTLAWRVQQQAYATLGVDHYWQVDLARGVVEVFVRDGVGFRHAETLTRTGEWVDFGIGVVVLDVPTLVGARLQRVRRHPAHN